MNRLALIAAMIILTSNPAYSQGDLYVCITEDAVEMDERGKLVRNRVTEGYKKDIFDKFSIDAATGILRRGTAPEPIKMKILNKGSHENDMVASRIVIGKTGWANEFRIRVWLARQGSRINSVVRILDYQFAK